MEITLEKIELVKDRTGVTYAEAKAALENSEGSVVDAIIAIEETINAGEKKRKFGKKGEALFSRLKELIKKGNVSKIQVKREGEIVLNVPVNVGIVGVVIAPIAAVVAVVAAFGFRCTIEVVKNDGTIIDVSDVVSEAAGTVVEKSGVVAGEVREKSADIYAKGKEKGAELYAKGKEKGAELYAKGKEKAEEAREKIRKNEEEFDFSECFEEGENGDKVEVEIEEKIEDIVKDIAEETGEKDKE